MHIHNITKASTGHPNHPQKGNPETLVPRKWCFFDTSVQGFHTSRKLLKGQLKKKKQKTKCQYDMHFIYNILYTYIALEIKGILIIEFFIQKFKCHGFHIVCCCWLMKGMGECGSSSSSRSRKGMGEGDMAIRDKKKKKGVNILKLFFFYMLKKRSRKIKKGAGNAKIKTQFIALLSIYQAMVNFFPRRRFKKAKFC